MDRASIPHTIPLSLTNRTIHLGGREQLVSERRLNLSTCGGGASGATSRFAVLPAALPPLEAASLLAEASTLGFDTRPDSVDRDPAHELYLVRDGVVQPGAHGLHELTKPSVAWLTQLVNQLHPELCAGQCAACTSLVRRYRPGERRGHQEHIDGHAAVTVGGASPEATLTLTLTLTLTS